LKFGASKLMFEASKLKFGASKSRFGASKLMFGASKLMFEASKLKFEASKLKFGASKSRFGASKLMFEASKSRFGASKSRFGASKLMFEASKLKFGASKSRFGASKLMFEASKLMFETSNLDFDASETDFGASRPALEASDPPADAPDRRGGEPSCRGGANPPGPAASRPRRRTRPRAPGLPLASRTPAVVSSPSMMAKDPGLAADQETTAAGPPPTGATGSSSRAPGGAGPGQRAALHAQVLIVEDEIEHAEVMADALRKPGHVCTMVHGLAEAEEELRHGAFDVIVTDLVMDVPDAGLRVLDLARTHQPEAETIMVTAHGDVPTAKAALKGGAYDFIEKPLDLDVFRNLVDRAAETVLLRHQNSDLRGRLDDALAFEGIIGESMAIRQVIATIRQVAPSTIPVLVTGESGTGKELVAHAIHVHSRRAKKPFVPFNAAGQSETLLEDQLFGHVRGAFTGADRDREGVFEYADGGTLFLDEIGDMPLPMQSKLLRVLETGEIVRLGANAPSKTDVRFVSATNRDLKALSAAGTFREDLYFRIRGAEIHVPPLRERREDVPRIVQHAIGRFAAEMDRPAPSITEPAMLRLVSYAWPGNVRELLNVVQKMVVTASGDAIDVRDVPPEIMSDDDEFDRSFGSLAGVGLERLEKEAIRQTLAMTGGNREQAARMLGIGERTLYRKLKEYGLK